MIVTVLIIDAVLLGILALWLSIINATGNTDQRGGAGFVAFFLAALIVVASSLIIVGNLLAQLIWG
jgi:hypothetical protein